MILKRCVRHSVGCAAGIVVLLAGCADKSVSRSGASTENPWQIADEPFITIGDDDDSGEELFHLVRFVKLVDDERLVVIDWASNSVRVFDLEGNLLHRFAGEGEGPSEIRFSISGVWIAALDTLNVIDGREIKSFSLDGGFLGSRQLEASVWAEVLVGVFDDGSMVVTGVDSGGDVEVEDGVGRERLRYQYVSPKGDDLGVLAWGLNRITYPPQRGDGAGGPPVVSGVGNLQHPLGPRSSSLIRDDTLFIAEGLRPEVTLVTKAGEIGRTISLPDEAISYAEARDSLGRALQRSGSKIGLARLDAAPVLDSVPRVGGMLMDAEGLLWVKRFDPSTDSNQMSARQYLTDARGGEWWVVDRKGVLKGTVSLPDRFVPMDIGKSLIAGITIDELEVERVVVYRILNRR